MLAIFLSLFSCLARYSVFSIWLSLFNYGVIPVHGHAVFALASGRLMRSVSTFPLTQQLYPLHNQLKRKRGKMCGSFLEAGIGWAEKPRLFVKDYNGKDLVNLGLALRISCRHHWRDDLWQVYAEYPFDKTVVLFEDPSQEACRIHLALMEALLRERGSFLY